MDAKLQEEELGSRRLPKLKTILDSPAPLAIIKRSAIMYFMIDKQIHFT